jgi:uncharacterized membrane protein
MDERELIALRLELQRLNEKLDGMGSRQEVKPAEAPAEPSPIPQLPPKPRIKVEVMPVMPESPVQSGFSPSFWDMTPRPPAPPISRSIPAPSMRAAQADAGQPNSKPEAIQPSEAPRPKPQFARSEETPWAIESFSVSWILGGIGVLCFVLAAAFMVKLAVASGWLNGERQVTLTGLLGAGLVVSGLVLRQRDMKYFGALVGAGLVVLHIAVYAGHLIHHLYDVWGAMLALSMLSAGTLVMWGLLKQETYLGMAVLGTYLVPLLLSGLWSQAQEVNLYFLFWSLIYSVLGLLTARRLMIILSAYLAILVYSAMTVMGWLPSGPYQAWMQAVQFLLFSAMVMLYSLVHHEEMSRRDAWFCLPVLLIFYSHEYSLMMLHAADWASFTALGFGAVIYGGFQLIRLRLDKHDLESGPMVGVFVTMVMVHAFYFTLLPDQYKPWVGIGVALAVPWVLPRVVKNPHYWPSLVAVIVVGMVEYSRAAWMSSQLDLAGAMAYNLGFAAAIFAGLILAVHHETPMIVQVPLLVLALIQALLGLSRMGTYLSAGQPSMANVLTDTLWAVLGLGLMAMGWVQHSKLLVMTALIALLAVSGKLLLIDVAMLHTWVRVVCLMVFGGILFGAGFWYRHIENTWGQ